MFGVEDDMFDAGYEKGKMEMQAKLNTAISSSEDVINSLRLRISEANDVIRQCKSRFDDSSLCRCSCYWEQKAINEYLEEAGK